MTKQLITLALIAAFGIAHAADLKPATAEVKAAAPVAATVKAEAPKVADAVKALEAKPVVPEVKKDEAKPLEKKVKHAKKHVKKTAAVVAPTTGPAGK